MRSCYFPSRYTSDPEIRHYYNRLHWVRGDLMGNKVVIRHRQLKFPICSASIPRMLDRQKKKLSQLSKSILTVKTSNPEQECDFKCTKASLAFLCTCWKCIFCTTSSLRQSNVLPTADLSNLLLYYLKASKLVGQLHYLQHLHIDMVILMTTSVSPYGSCSFYDPEIWLAGIHNKILLKQTAHLSSQWGREHHQPPSLNSIHRPSGSQRSQM